MNFTKKTIYLIKTMKLTKFWSEVTKEELERIDLVNRVIDNCKKDDEYLRDIVNEYFQELESTTRGLKGIQETLEERENQENE